MHYRDKVVLQTYTSEELHDRLKYFAMKENRTISNLLHVLIQKYVTEQELREKNDANV